MVYKVLYLSVGNNATLIIIGVNNSMKAIMELIEAYILRMTKRNASQLESVLDDLENLESDLVSLITDVKEVIEGRI